MDLNAFEKKKVSRFMMVAATMIWGITFIAQSEGAKHIEPFFFNAARFWIGALVILPISYLRSKKDTGKSTFWVASDNKMITIKGAFFDSIAIFLGVSLQQIGIAYTTPGKAAFLVSLSIVFVPIIGMFLGEKIKSLQWVGVFTAVVGVSLISLNEQLQINVGDFMMIGSAFFLAINTIVSGYYNKTVESLKYTLIRFVFAAIICTIISFLTETTNLEMVKNALPSILFAGIISSGVGYTLQSIAQINLDDLTTALILSLESVFGAVFAWILLGQVLSFKELAGCVIVFCSVIYIQLIDGKKIKLTQLI